MNTNFLKQIDKRWTLFLDRDGVVNERIYGDYVRSPDDFCFLPAVPESIAILTKIFNKIIIVTNQQGVGKGLMSENEVNAIHLRMKNKIEATGGKIDAVYYCTDLTSTIVNCRKPNIMMALKAKADFPEIDFPKSLMIGDSESDIFFGKNAGMKTIFISKENKIPENLNPDMIFSGLDSFTKHLQSIRNTF